MPIGPRFAWGVVAVALAAYGLGFLVFYPEVITNDDEMFYVEHARLFAEGRTTAHKPDPLTGGVKPIRTNFYPPGTAMAMAPFIAAAGWEGAFCVPFLALLIAVLVLARWLHEEGRSPLFALLLLGFPAVLVMGRVAMSDVPNLAAVTLALWLFWRRQGESRLQWLASGFIAGLSLLFRDTSAALFAPIYAGTVLRRERNWWALLVGGLAGVAVKLACNWIVFGDLLYVRTSYIVELDSLWTRLWIQLTALVLFVPGGLLLALAYRGPRAVELKSALLLFLLFFALQKNTTFASEWSKRLILDWRYILPMLPLMIFGMAEVVPRLWRWLLARLTERRRSTLQRLAAALLGLWMAGIVAGSFAAHGVFDGWSRSQAEIRDIIHRETGDDSLIITNQLTSRKFLRILERSFLHLDRKAITVDETRTLVERYGEVFVVFLDRNDTDFRRADARTNEAFIEALEPLAESIVDRQMTPSERLQIWRLLRPPDGRSPVADG